MQKYIYFPNPQIYFTKNVWNPQIFFVTFRMKSPNFVKLAISTFDIKKEDVSDILFFVPRAGK